MHLAGVSSSGRLLDEADLAEDHPGLYAFVPAASDRGPSTNRTRLQALLSRLFLANVVQGMQGTPSLECGGGREAGDVRGRRAVKRVWECTVCLINATPRLCKARPIVSRLLPFAHTGKTVSASMVFGRGCGSAAINDEEYPILSNTIQYSFTVDLHQRNLVPLPGPRFVELSPA